MNIETHFLENTNWDDSDIEVAASINSPHLDDLVKFKLHLLKAHAIQHMMGAEDTPEHETCLERLDEVDTYLTRGWQGIWN